MKILTHSSSQLIITGHLPNPKCHSNMPPNPAHPSSASPPQKHTIYHSLPNIKDLVVSARGHVENAYPLGKSCPRGNWIVELCPLMRVWWCESERYCRRFGWRVLILFRLQIRFGWRVFLLRLQIRIRTFIPSIDHRCYD